MARIWCVLLCPLWTLTVLALGLENEFKGDPPTSFTTLAHSNATILCSINISAGYAFNGMMWYQDGMWKVAKENINRIKYRDDDLESKYSIADDNSLLIFDALVTDSANYTCKIFTKQMVSDGGKFAEENATVELLVQDVPSAPGSLTVYDFDSRQVKVSWSMTTMDNNSPITLYLIQIRSDSQKWHEGREVVVSADTSTITIQELQPYTKYFVRVFSRNSVGKSDPSPESAPFITSSESPSSPPLSVQAVSTNSTVIKLSWKPPPLDTHQGEVRGFEVQYKTVLSNTAHVISVEDPDKQSILIEGLMPYTDYIIAIAAFNDAGNGPVAQTSICTLEGFPSKPRITHVSSTMSTSFYVNWEAPKFVNGEIKSYVLQWVYHKMNKTRIIHGHLTNPMSAFIGGLEPYTQYKICVAASTGGGKGEFSDIYPALTDVTGPSVPIVENVTEINQTSVYVAWSPPKKIHRQVDSYFIQYWDIKQRASHKEVVVGGHLNEKVLEDLPGNVKYSLRIAGGTQSIFTKVFYIGDFTESMTFELSMSAESLDEAMKSANKAVESADEAVVSAGIIAGIVICTIIILIVALIFIGYRSITCRKYYRAAYSYLAVPSNSQAPPTAIITVPESFVENSYPPVNVNDFIQHVRFLHADSDVGFAQEFEDVNKHTNVELQSEGSGLPENKQKNRYINISAYDHSRVFLRNINGRQRHSDYINANYIDGYEKPRAYIATQGPLPQTFADFWRMVWEQNCVIIIMITNLEERGRRKCDMYWPEEGVQVYGTVSVKHLNTFSRAHYTVRMFSLKYSKMKKKHSSERIVYQYHYTEWPDHGVPDFTLPVLKFVQKSAFANPPGAGPIVVHCSAGVGRTGTYTLIDTMIESMNHISTINVPSFLLHIRQNRNFLVQTEEQYMLIHDALAEYILSSGNTEIREQNISSYLQDITHSGEKEEESLLQKQYKLVTAFTPKFDDLIHATKPVNKSKNRDPDLLPVGVKRVILPAKPGIEGSDYINASYLQGYYTTKEFIVTQHPTQETVEDFWRMVWDQNSSVILLLSQVDNKEYQRFWPEKDNRIEVDTGDFNLSFREEEHTLSYITRDFLLESNQDDYILMTRIISTNYWPESCSPTHTVFELIHAVRELHKQNDRGPVIVVDRFGGVEAGTFCALWSLYDQVEHDKTIDIYHLTKLYHLKRPGLIGSEDDFLFLYKAIESFCREKADREANASPNRFHGSIKKNGTLPRSTTVQSKIESNV